MSPRHLIAIIDDDRSVRKALQRLLRASDLDANTFGSGREFLDSVGGALPDCLVLDLQMPEMNGLELQRHLIQAGRRLPTIVITGHDEPGMEAQCMAAGASRYLRKPLDDKVLLDAIRHAIATAGALC